MAQHLYHGRNVLLVRSFAAWDATARGSVSYHKCIVTTSIKSGSFHEGVKTAHGWWSARRASKDSSCERGLSHVQRFQKPVPADLLDRPPHRQQQRCPDQVLAHLCHVCGAIRTGDWSVEIEGTVMYTSELGVLALQIYTSLVVSDSSRNSCNRCNLVNAVANKAWHVL